MIEQPTAGRPASRRALGVEVDLRLPDVLDHPDRGTASKSRRRARGSPAPGSRSGREARVRDPLPRQLRLRLRQRDPHRLDAVRCAACITKLPQPQPTSSTRSPSASASFVQTRSSFASWASSRVGVRSPEKSLRLRDAGEEGAGVGHRLVEEEREELVADVVVVADGLAVALGGVLAAAEVDLGLRRGRRAAHAGGSHGCGDQPGLRRRPNRRRLPVVEQPDHGIHVVDLDRAGDVGAPQPELPGRRDRVGDRVLGARPESGTASIRVGGGEPGAVPELDRERPLGEGALDLLDEWFRGHVPTLAPSRVQFRLGLPNSSPQR